MERSPSLIQKRRLCAAGALLCAFLPGAMARAERADRDQPIYVQADRWTHDDLKRINYDGKNEIATLVGRAVVRRLSGSAKVIDEIHGHVIRYEAKNDFYTAQSSADASGNPSGRVRAMLSPRTGAASSKEGAAAPLEMSNTLDQKTQP